MADDKYIVFKREDFFDIIDVLNSKLMLKIDEIELPDAVVIRRQDIFAPPALDAYANSIRVAIQLAPQGEITTRLEKIADYFHQQAVLSWNAYRQLPD